ncbi:MAG: hypothetical protein UT64_C0011G0001 [Candidatus Falkowbacteria bacterium GW2011_GWF2_39_8]|uniref:DUF11 domain-containing protein n=1 Tax=Candidatus Falkowbacteria bacterium GW2011_GWF2_39_8 TaxID=1618642 RepID=A0A0G0PZA4_9BACT|nr:MAG: hypothetical protein UT64_C0011G0001 [Candidatus Falkowbacteria bacterium GW2011_GWF2_39_8]
MPNPNNQLKKDNPKSTNPPIPESNKDQSQVALENSTSEKENEKVDFLQGEIRENEIDEGLSEIYPDENGNMADVKKLDIKKAHGFIYKLLVSAVLLSLLFIAGKYGYDYYLQKTAGSKAISFTVESEKEIVAGKEFYYTIAYKNFDKVDLKDITITTVFPDNFIFLESSMPTSTNDNTWKIEKLDMRRSGEIKIKGKLIGEEGQKNILLASMLYTPVNFSSEFKKETSFENKISSIGIEFNFEADTDTLVGEETSLSIKYKAKADNSINSFRITAEPNENIEILNSSSTAIATTTEENNATTSDPMASSTFPGIWQVEQVTDQENEIIIKLKFKDKIEQGNLLNLKFEHSTDGQKYLPFLKKEIPFEIMKRNLNLNLIINGSRTDQGIDFDQTLNYSIAYSNKGDTEMTDVVIMAVLESDFLDWKSLDDKNSGVIKNDAIIWTKAEIPGLATITPNTTGSIDFSIKVSPLGEIDPNKKHQVKSYATFSVGNIKNENKLENRSNEIIGKINSDLSVKEQIKYFNDDNIAVGSGPLPPKVGETTSFKVYWDLSNNLNELTDLKIESVLPQNVSWQNKNQTDLGTIQYDQASRKITWNIGRLPITVYKATAEFDISVTPTEEDRNKIMILLSGTIQK